jgi:hypothetical protein
MLPGAPQPSLEVEKCWDQTHVGPPYRTGGPFAKFKTSVPQYGVKGNGKYTSKGKPGYPPGFWMEYHGGFTNPTFSGDASVQTYLDACTSPGDLAAFPSIAQYTATAFKRTMPSVQEANVAQFLYEFREVPRMLKTTAEGFSDLWLSLGGGSKALRQPKKYANQFLNVQFGWLPFVRDLKDINRVFWKSHEYIAQKIRDNGRWIRRSRLLETTESLVRLSRQLGQTGCWPSANFQIQGVCNDMVIDGITCFCYNEVYMESKLRVWSEGQFTYYRPEFDASLQGHESTLNKAQQLLTLYGARINPAVVYKVLPWTWLIDWFASVGDFIDVENAIRNDGVASKYLYVMHKRENNVRQVSHINFCNGMLTLEWMRQTHSKQRYGASNPYGFGLTWESLSPKQLTILAALGLTRFS